MGTKSFSEAFPKENMVSKYTFKMKSLLNV